MLRLCNGLAEVSLISFGLLVGRRLGSFVSFPAGASVAGSFDDEVPKVDALVVTSFE